LGWSIRPNVTAEIEGKRYTSNSIGIRSLREYQPQKPEGTTRIAAFGPSFTGGWEVDDQEVWTVQIETERADLEVMNWGVGAYGTDQSLLRYQTKGVDYKPDIVLIGYEEDNLWRNVNRYRPYYIPPTGAPFPKPIYHLKQEQLQLIEVPFNSFDTFFKTLQNQPDQFIELTCPLDYFCEEEKYRSHPFDGLASFRLLRTLLYETRESPTETKLTDTQVKLLSLRIITQFVEEVVKEQSTPVVIFYPQSPATLEFYENGISPEYQEAIPLLQETVGVPVIDLLSVFVQAKQTSGLDYPAFFVSETGHYSELGNKVVAEAVLKTLCELGLISC
jgi:hypothetical protein